MAIPPRLCPPKKTLPTTTLLKYFQMYSYRDGCEKVVSSVRVPSCFFHKLVPEGSESPTSLIYLRIYYDLSITKSDTPARVARGIEEEVSHAASTLFFVSIFRSYLRYNCHKKGVL